MISKYIYYIHYVRYYNYIYLHTNIGSCCSLQVCSGNVVFDLLDYTLHYKHPPVYIRFIDMNLKIKQLCHRVKKKARTRTCYAHKTGMIFFSLSSSSLTLNKPSWARRIRGPSRASRVAMNQLCYLCIFGQT